MRQTTIASLVGVVLACASMTPSSAQERKKGNRPVWMNPETARENPDFLVQGEYTGKGIGAQVIALGKGCFQAVVLPGGLPGAGWDTRSKIVLDGQRAADHVAFAAATGEREYDKRVVSPDKFTATNPFPPKTQKSWQAQIKGEVMQIATDAGESMRLTRTVRQSPTLGAKAPPDAIVLFDGKLGPELKGGVVTEWGTLHPGSDKYVVTTREFSNYTLHVEFMTCFSPDMRSFERGNSGCYLSNGQEVQILDSFGLDGTIAEGGSLYKTRPPDLNMILPPLTWQTYDIEFVAPAKGTPARITVKLNGVVIHNQVDINRYRLSSGPLKFQNHGDWVQYRNIWILDRTPDLDPETDDTMRSREE